MNYFKTISVAVFCVLASGSFAEKTPPEGVVPVKSFELEQYLGLWYEVARTDNYFERGLESVTAEYHPLEDGSIRVINRGYHPEKDKWKSSKAKAHKIGDPSEGKLKVTFFWPFSSGYHIFELDHESYQYALVSGDSHDYMWILAREPELPQTTIEKLLKKAEDAGFDTSTLIWVEHNETDPALTSNS